MKDGLQAQIEELQAQEKELFEKEEKAQATPEQEPEKLKAEAPEETPEPEQEEEAPDDIKADSEGDEPEEESKEAESPDTHDAQKQEAHKSFMQRKARRDRIAELEDTVKQLKEAQAKPEGEQQVEAEPDKLLEPESWLEWKEKQLDERYSKLEQKMEQQERYAQEQQMRAQLEQTKTQSEAEFKKLEPAYDDALQYLRERTREAVEQTLEYNDDFMTPAEIQAQVKQLELAETRKAYDMGIDPAQNFYLLARKAGWEPKQQASKPSSETPKQKVDLERIKDAKRRSKSLNKTSGGASSMKSAADVNAVFDLSLAEQQKVWNSMPDHEFQRLASLED